MTLEGLLFGRIVLPTEGLCRLVRLQRRLNCQVKVLIGEFVTAP